jgi:membrane-associated phospholipid phosphatase
MSPFAVALIVGFVVLLGTGLTCVVCLDRKSAVTAGEDFVERLFTVSPYLGLTGLFFLVRRVTNDATVHLSEKVGFRITDWIYGVEGLVVEQIQNLTPDALIPVFSGFYMFGFAYLLITPIVLYLLAPALRPLKELLVAYVLNYLSGAVLYTLFIAYGPRVYVSEHVDGLLYDLFPESQELTAAVSSNTDVFPSLHTSLSIIVLLFAWQTRDILPNWFPIASFVAAGVVLSTMILGIHWVVDVVAGVVLAVCCVLAARYLVGLFEGKSSGKPQSEETNPETA